MEPWEESRGKVSVCQTGGESLDRGWEHGLLLAISPVVCFKRLLDHCPYLCLSLQLGEKQSRVRHSVLCGLYKLSQE